MVSERPPIFVPSGKGFKAAYSLTFSDDLNRLIYLMGANQGSPIEAKTLMVDNGLNSSACTVALRGQVIPVAAYTVRYIDCSGAMDLIVTGGTASAVIPLEVLTYSMPESVVVKKSLNIGGKPPISVTVPLTQSNFNVPVKILSIGNGITSWLNMTLLNSGVTIAYGFTSSTTLGSLGVQNVPLEIPYDDSREFWFKCTTGSSAANVSAYGG